MRLLYAVWFVFVTASATVWGQGARAPAARTPREPDFFVDVRQFGAKADLRTDNAEAFQLAVDQVAARIDKAMPEASGMRASGVVFIPSAVGSYRLSRPVWVDHPFIEIRGEGQGTRVECFPQRNHPLFLFGLRRVAKVKVDGKVQTLEATARYRPDLFGKLDASAVPKPGVRGGFRTFGETLIQSQASPLSDGPRHSRKDFTTDHWYETTTLTVEIAAEGPKGGPIPREFTLFGIGVVTKDIGYPLHLYTDGENHFVVKFSTQDKRFGPLTAHRFSFSTGGSKGVQRLAFQIDLERAEVSAFVNGREVAVEEGPGPLFKPGKHFAENDYFPLLIADAGGDRPTHGSNSGKDWTLLGFLFSKTLRYERQGAGRPQRRRDKPGTAINDAFRYFTPPEDDPGSIGYFPFTDFPAETGRMLMIQGGPASGGHKAAAFLIHSLQNLQGGILDNGIRDLHLVGAHLYGQNLALGQVLDMRISGIRSSGAYHGIGSLSNGAHYTVRVEDCTLDATDSGYFALDEILWARNLHFEGAGRVTMRLVGSVANVENVFVGFHHPNNESTIKIHAGDYGGNYSFRNVQVDYEGDYYLHTPIYAEVHPYASETSLRLTDVFLGTVGDDIPILTLRDAPAAWHKTGYLSVDALQSFTKKVGAVVEVDGPGWRGTLRGVSVGESPGVRFLGKPTESTRIKIDP